MTSTIHSSMPNDIYTPLYSQYLENQQQWISSLFNASTSALEHTIMSNVLKTIESDRNRKENIMMITLCQLAQKIHCNGVLIQSIISNESDEKQQNNQTHEYLSQILSILKTKQTRKLNALESKIYDVEIQLKSHTNMLQNIYNEIKNYNAQNYETTPTQCEKILHKIHHMDKKIDSIKSKQTKVNKCSEKQTEIMNQLKAEHGQIEEALLAQSISIQSVNSKQQLNTETLSSINTHLKSLPKYDSSQSTLTNTTTSPQLFSLCKQISSMKTQSNSSFMQLSSLSKQIASIQTNLSSLTNSKSALLSQSVSKFDMSSGTPTDTSIEYTNNSTSHFDDKSPKIFSSQPIQHITPKFEFQFSDTAFQPLKSLETTANDTAFNMYEWTNTESIQSKPQQPFTEFPNAYNKSLNTVTNPSIYGYESKCNNSTFTNDKSFPIHRSDAQNKPQQIHLSSLPNIDNGSKTKKTSSDCKVEIRSGQIFTTNSSIASTNQSNVQVTHTTSHQITSKQAAKIKEKSNQLYEYSNKQSTTLTNTINEFEFKFTDPLTPPKPSAKMSVCEFKCNDTITLSTFSKAIIDNENKTANQPDFYKNLGNNFYKKKQFNDAIIQYKIAQDLCPSDPTYLMNESAALFMMEEWDKCKDLCYKVIRIAEEPEWFYKAYKRLGSIEEKQNNMTAAIDCYVMAFNHKYDKDLQVKIKKWVGEQKQDMTEAEMNILTNWCKNINDSDAIQCGKCGYHAAIKYPSVM